MKRPGITGEFNTRSYDEMMRRMRDRGWGVSKNPMDIVISGKKT